MADIIVTDAHGLPDKAYLSFRVGDMRRQMQFRPGCKFKFDGDSPPRHFILDVFERVGTAQVAVADLTSGEPGVDREGSVHVVRTNGDSMNVSVKVVSPGGAIAAPGEKLPLVPIEAGNQSAGLDEASEAKRVFRQQAAVKAKSYLDSHKVQKLLQGMMHSMLERQPQDAMEFMSSYLEEQRKQLIRPPTREPTLEVRRRSYEQVDEVPLPDWSSQPGLGEDEMPGFATDGSEPLPDLSNHSSLMAEVLREDAELYDRLCKLRTPCGSTLAKCIKTGVDNRGHAMIKSIGITAVDEFCYDIFRDVFGPVINKWHGNWPEEAVHHDDIDPLKVTDASIDSIGGRVIGVEVRAVRNLCGLRMPPACSREERREVELLVSQALANLPSDLQGSYLPLRGSQSHQPTLGGMTEDEQRQLMEERLLFEEPDSAVSLATGMGRHWPDARGVFRSNRSLPQSQHEEVAGKCLSVWVNEADHLKISSRRDDADLKQAFDAFARAEGSIKASLKEAGKQFAHSPHFGFLSTDPTQIGTGMTLSVRLKVPLLCRHKEFKALCHLYGLQARIFVGDRECDTHRGVWEVTGSDRLGYSEAEQVNVVIEGCKFLLDLEKQLESGEELDWKEILHEELDEPLLQEDEHPGFPANDCPATIPDLSLHHSAMADVLKADPEIYARLRSLTTSSGTSLARCIKTGIDNQGHPMIKTVGLVAGCADSYDVFRDLFDAVIQKKHPDVDVATLRHPTDMNHAHVMSERIHSDSDRVLLVSIRMSRNLRGFRMAPACDKEERRKVESVILDALEQLPCGLKGEYFPVKGSESHLAKPFGMSAEDEEGFAKEKFGFHQPDSEVQLSSGLGRHWPDARGIWLALNRSAAVRLNEEDHLRIVVTQPGQDLKEAFARACRVHEGIEDAWGFARNSRFGYLGVCPSNLGTCLIANISVRLPLLSTQSDFRTLCKKLNVMARANVGLGFDGVQDISNANRLGSSEVDQVNSVIEACRCLLRLEIRLERGQSIDWDEEPAADQLKTTYSRCSLRKSTTARLSAELMEDLALPAVEFSEVPGLGTDAYPGFPSDACPEELPDLSRHCSMMADVLKRDSSIYERLKKVNTASGVNLAQCIKTGIDNAGHPMMKTVGAVAGDSECYETFASLFDPLIKAVHRTGKFAEIGQHTTDLDASKVSDSQIDPTGNHVVNVCIKGQRNIAGIRMLPACSSEERIKVEQLAYKALEELGGNFRGEYFPLQGSATHDAKPEGMSDEEADRLLDDNLLFQEPDSKTVLATGSARNWPEARGVFSTHSGKFAAWINEEDHLKLILSEYGGNLKAAFERFCQAEATLRDALRKEGHDFAWNSRLGYISTCPSNLGSGLRIEVTCRLTNLIQHADWKAMRRRLPVQVRNVEDDENLCYVVNKERLASSEVEQMNTVIEACRQLVDLEMRLINGEHVDLLAPLAA